MSYYIHDIPGRLRVKSPLLKRREHAALAVQRLLTPIDGITLTTVNPVTGSLVVHYDLEIVGSQDILEALKRAGYFDLAKAVTNDEYIYSTVSQTGRFVWRVLFGAAFETVFLKSPSLSLLGLLI